MQKRSLRCAPVFASPPFVALATLLATSVQAGPCAPKIDRVQAQVDARIDAIAGSGRAGIESRAARLHYQPTPASIAVAERRLDESAGTRRALGDLARARKADREGHAQACEAALAEARAAIAP